MNKAQRTVVLWVCRALAAGCFLTFIVGFFLPWAYGRAVLSEPLRDGFPFLALLWGVATPIVLLGIGSFLSLGGAPEKSGEKGAEESDDNPRRW